MRTVLPLRQRPMNDEDRSRVRSLLSYMPQAWGVEHVFLGAKSIILHVVQHNDDLIVPRVVHGIPVEIKLMSEKEDEAA